MAELPSSAAVVVIGGGVMGASTAYHLATAGVEVAVLERDTIGSGSTGKSAGGFRAQFADELNVRMAVENIRRLERFESDFGIDIDLKQFGYLFLLRESEVESFRRAVALQRSLGVPSELITPEDALAMVPGIRIHDLAAATFCPWDGSCTPESVALGYAMAASRAGASVVQGCEVTGIAVTGDRIRGVTTTNGFVSASQVVLTAGVWSPELATPLGFCMPVRAVKRYIWLTRGSDPFPRRLPLVIDFATGFYFHREAKGLAMGGRAQAIEDLAPEVINRAPALIEMEITHSWWGYYAVTPDNNAIIGTHPGMEGLHYATGFSGHGFQQGPVVGEYLAELVIGGEPTFDLSPFDMRRFETGSVLPETAVI
ncbi:MAG: FAD-binding oxidoreductase [bacterium]|nr:FAD-binding oxidoreductase [bacterium]MDE0290374.1 FAD-binding oxidoreductase [bacterium]MDE0437189.1 FAD-binding oxidoreductase [bacterium]